MTALDSACLESPLEVERSPSLTEPQVLGIDLGGTAIKLGRFTVTGQCLQTLTLPTPQPAEPEPTLAAVCKGIAQVDPQRTAIAIGIGTPGPADRSGRVARIAINLPHWIDIPVAAWLEAKTGRPTIVENDANCAGLGEAWLGAGRSFQNMILLTLGTGVGGAIFINGQLFTGRQGAAGELGLISMDPEGHPCKSGNRGSLEQHLAIAAIQRRAGKDPAELFQLARSGNYEALTFWQAYGRDLGIGLTSLIYVLTPDAIIIGGGICDSSEFFFPAAWREIEQRVMPTSRDGLQLLRAELGNRAGMLGAAKLAIDRYLSA